MANAILAENNLGQIMEDAGNGHNCVWMPPNPLLNGPQPEFVEAGIQVQPEHVNQAIQVMADEDAEFEAANMGRFTIPF